MKCSQLVEDSQTFAGCADERRGYSKAGRQARRRAEYTRRRLIRSIVRVCNALSDDELCGVAEYVLLIAK
jgi:hypothetical protein